MSIAQTALKRGRRVTEAYRGVLVKDLKAGPWMVSTVEPWEPESDPKTPSQETRTFSLVKIARDVLATAGANILIGSTLVNQVTHERYRVTKIMDNQQDLLVIYHCETTVPA